MASAAKLPADPTLDLAFDILSRGARLAVCSTLAPDQVEAWTRAAQYAVDGDTADLLWLEEQFAEAERAEMRRGGLDEDQFFRESTYAEAAGLGE